MSKANWLTQVRKASRFTWSYRLELAIAVAVVALFFVTSSLPVWVSALVWAVVVGAGVYKRANVLPRTHELLHGARVGRALKRAARDCGFPDLRVGKIVHTLPGEWVDVEVPRGSTVNELEKRARAMAGCLRVSDVRVAPGAHRAAANVSIIRRDPFDAMGALRWPLVDAETVDVRKGIPFMIDEYGRLVHARLLSRNLILGGAPDAGKSVSLRIFAAAAALDPTVKLWLMDAKPNAVEFGVWAGAAHSLVRGRDLEAAIDTFAQLSERVERRYYEISARNLDFVPDDMELDVLMIDELPQFTRSFETDSKAQQSATKTIREGIWKLIALGRAAGMITIISAQKPTADIVPSESRDLIDHKFALHCNTKAMSDAILGQGAGEESAANAADIPSGQPGVGYYVGDDGVRKGRAFFISRDEAAEVASRVASRQLDVELSTLSA